MPRVKLGRRAWLLKLGYAPEHIVGMSITQMHRLAYVGLLAGVFGHESVVIPLNVDSQHRLHEAMYQVLSTLNPREADVLRMRFGIECIYSHTMREIATRYDVSSERIRQIECKALRKLKHPSRSSPLFPFIVRGL